MRRADRLFRIIQVPRRSTQPVTASPTADPAAGTRRRQAARGLAKMRAIALWHAWSPAFAGMTPAQQSPPDAGPAFPDREDSQNANCTFIARARSDASANAAGASASGSVAVSSGATSMAPRASTSTASANSS